MAKYSIRCTLLPTPKKDGTHAVRMSVSWSGNRIYRTLDHTCPAEAWDAARGMPKRTQAALQREINTASGDVSDMFDRCHYEKRQPTKEEVKTAMGVEAVDEDRETDKPDIPTAVKLFDDYLREHRRQWAVGTYKRHLTLRNRIPDTPISGFGAAQLRKFVEALYKDGLINTTVAKGLASLRTFLRWCENQGMETGDWHRFSMRFKGEADREPLYLNQDELNAIIALDLASGSTLYNVRDTFLFCCFSGLRYSDAAKLTWDDIHDGYLSVVTTKTSEPLRIELNAITAGILARQPHERKLALPCISNQKTNDALHELAKLAEINTPTRRVWWVGSERHEEVVPKWQLVTSHCARRTFVVQGLALGIPAEVIMRWTGHSDHKAMKPYIAIVDKLKSDSMAKFDQLLKK